MAGFLPSLSLSGLNAGELPIRLLGSTSAAIELFPILQVRASRKGLLPAPVMVTTDKLGS
jgi:hypothetical protein